MECKLAWLSGFWDGEGSVGISRSKNTLRLDCQLSHTEYESVVEIMSILDAVGIYNRGYTYQERDPAKHRDAHYIRIGGAANIMKLARLLLPYAVTKKRHWEISIAWAESRIADAGGVDANGRILRGGIQKGRVYSDSEMALANELSILNRRGPKDRESRREGRILR